jgi:hypothetical protein
VISLAAWGNIGGPTPATFDHLCRFGELVRRRKRCRLGWVFLINFAD